MSQVSVQALPVTGGLIIGGRGIGLSWVAVAGIAVVALGIVVVRWAARARRASR